MRTTNRMARTAALAMVAGLAVAPAWAQDRENDRRRDQPTREQDRARDRDTSRASHQQLVFQAWSDMKGTDIYNQGDESLGDVSDLVIARGSGRVEFAVVSTGSVLGMGGKTVLIPYQHLAWDHARERLLLSMSPEQIKSMPEFSREAWTEAGKTSRDQARNQQALAEALARAAALELADPYAGQFGANASPQRIEGEVVRVEQRSTPGAGEITYVTIRGKNGEEQRVSLGPSWYLAGENLEPARGSAISINAVRVQTPRGEEYVVTDLSRDGRTIALREKNTSRGIWMSDPERRDTGRDSWQGGVTSHYILASQVKGKPADCRGQKCGSVDDLVVECTSGTVGFLSIDPDQNFLGIADTKHLVPWTVTGTRWSGDVTIDASKEMILASARTPDDLRTLGASPDRVYRAYDVSVPAYTPRTNRDMDRDMKRDTRGRYTGWSDDSDFGRAVKSGKATTIKGNIVEIDHRSPWDGVDPGTYVIVEDQAGTRRTVYLGPATYAPANEFRKGQTVTIRTVEVNRDGFNTFYVARSAEADGRTYDYWQTQPAWLNPNNAPRTDDEPRRSPK